MRSSIPRLITTATSRIPRQRTTFLWQWNLGLSSTRTTTAAATTTTTSFTTTLRPAHNSVRWSSTSTSSSASPRDPQFGSGNLSSLAYHFKRQRHLPYFLEYLMWVVFGSEALQLIWLKMDYKEYQEKTEHKIRLLEEIIDRIEKGQEFTDDFREEIRMVFMHGGRQQHDGSDEDIDDDYLEKLIAASETPHRQQEAASGKGASSTAAEQPEKPSWPPAREEGGEKKRFFL
ncbi:hypothetical protein BDB00DRAFT_977098 [Zychaea mexicana]|uniref:uncharacterized protein n=1 Tax=Zychaea mexicana TaxID=64656 RepID=UPI0022FEC1F1|nr:uncharacterized protein BDB00DRAFT_977098 [Zychaea mexicana]KAI9492405.1 hypothetical protein BDB00DRAFT_977098 [Zychaea mexicana]